MQRTAAVDVARLFDTVVAEDVLPHVLHRWGPIPGVRGTSDLTGPWREPGTSRTVLLEDGNSARETIVAWERPDRYTYRLDSLTGPFGRLVDHAAGEWLFASTPTGSELSWTYTFTPANPLAAVVLEGVVRTAWSRYMDQAASLCARRAGTG